MECVDCTTCKKEHCYDAVYGPNTKQFWIYDNKKECYIDPPISVLDKVNEIAFKNGTTADCISGATADSMFEAGEYLVKLAEQEPDWLHDGNEYFEDMDI